MALLEEWVLPGPVTVETVTRVEEALRAAVPQEFDRTVSTDEGSVWVEVRVGEDDLEDLARHLDAPLSHFDGWEWEDEIDPLDEGDTYALRVELVNKVPETFTAEAELPILSVYSKDGDNLAAWPAAFVLASRLAHELGAVEPEDVPDPRDVN